jgi:hypothetical protein
MFGFGALSITLAATQGYLGQVEPQEAGYLVYRHA